MKIRKPLYEGDSILRSGPVEEPEIVESSSSFELSAIAVVVLTAIYSVSWLLG